MRTKRKTLKIDPEFRDLIPPISAAEKKDLERALVRYGGAREPIDVWCGVIVDGHHRYEICTRLKLKFAVREVEFADREEVKAWMFSHQIARRNLSTDQIVMIAALRGIDTKRGTTTAKAQASELAEVGRAALVVSGRLTIAAAYAAYLRATGRAPVRTRATPQGPSGVHAHSPPVQLACGQELKRQTVQVDADGNLRTRYDLSQTARREPLIDPIAEGHLVTKVTTRVDADGSVGMQHITTKPEEVARWRDTKAAIVEFVREHVRPNDTTPPPRKLDERLLTIYPLGDPHIGMLAWAPEVGESFDLRIAERELCECFRQLVAGAPKSKRAIITNLGDFWHSDSPSNRTPKSGHPLDVDGRHSKIGRVGLAIVETVIREALTKHESVSFRTLPGNHDPSSSFWLAETMRRQFADDPRLLVEPSENPYQYDVHGNVLLGWCHGDGAKADDLGALMATDVPELWGLTRFRYWHAGHIHHWTRKEVRGVVIDTHRTLAGRDAWHHHAGYRSGRALRAITYHERYGLESDQVVGIERVRDALLEAA